MRLEQFEKIDDVSPIAVFFNNTMDKLAALRKVCAPVSFMRNKEIADFQDESFCNMCRYEYWMHQVTGKLYKWKLCVEEYFTEDSDGDAMERLLESVYDPDDIVSETLPVDIWNLCKDILSQSHIGVIDSLKVIYGGDVEAFMVSDDGEPVPMTREDIELIDVGRQVDAEDDTKRMMAIAAAVSVIVQTIRSFKDMNVKVEEVMIMIHKITESLLGMDFGKAETVLKEWREML